MVIIGQAVWPNASSNQMGKCFAQLEPLPDCIAGKDYVKSFINEGIKVISLYYFDSITTEEALDFIQQRYAAFIKVPGYSYSIDLWYEADQALNLIGIPK